MLVLMTGGRAHELARALDRRRAELELLELREAPDILVGVYAIAGTGSR
jgi:hypothetical protein